MKDEVILALLGGLIGISIIRPDLFKSFFNPSKGDTAAGGGGGDTVAIVPPVVTSPYTQYNVTIGAPSFPAGGDVFSSSQQSPDNSKNAYIPSHKIPSHMTRATSEHPYEVINKIEAIKGGVPVWMQ